MKKIICLLLTSLMMITLVGCGEKEEETTEEVGLNEEYTTTETITKVQSKSNLDTDKEETVYVDADEYGSPYKIEVETTLKHGTEDTIEDINALDNVVNKSGDEEYTIEDGKIIFENHGEDITYKGTTNKELPVSISFTYYLDGKEVDVKDIVGKSGHLKVVVKYTNNQASSYKNITVPFIAATIVMLDDEIFYNVETDNGEIMSVSENDAVIMYGEPGLENSLKLKASDQFKDIELNDSATLEADVINFKMPYTTTIVTNGLFEDIDDEDFKDIDEMLDAVDDIDDQKKDIEDAKSDVKALPDTVTDKLKTSINSGIDQLLTYVPSNDEISAADGLIVQGIITTKSDADTKIEGLVSSSSGLFNNPEQTVTNLNKIKTNQSFIDASYFATFTSDTKLSEKITALKENVTLITAVKNDLKADNTDVTTLVTEVNTISNAFSYLINSNTTYGALKVLKSQFKYDDIKSEFTKISNEFVDILDEFEDNIDDLTEDIDDNLKTTIRNFKYVAKADKEYTSYVGLLKGQTSKVTFIIETDEVK